MWGVFLSHSVFTNKSKSSIFLFNFFFIVRLYFIYLTSRNLKNRWISPELENKQWNIYNEIYTMKYIQWNIYHGTPLELLWPLFWLKKCVSDKERTQLCLTTLLSMNPPSSVYDKVFTEYPFASCPVSWGSRIHQLLLCRGVRPPPPVCVLIWH